MFDFDIERTLLIEENERKPNRFMARALWIGLATQTICLVLNEMGKFHVDVTVMRCCYLIALICTVIPQVIAFHGNFAENPKCKYLVLGCVCVMTFVLTLGLFIFTAPLLLLPMLLAVQYNSRRVAKTAIIGSCICVAITPPLGGYLGLWDEGFLEYLLSNALGSFLELTKTEPISKLYTVGSVTGYISFPWLLIVVMYSRLILSAASKGEDNIQNRIQILKISRMDALTGLYNQNVYRQFLESSFPQKMAGVLFFDVDGLKEANDANGHEYGDLLLQRCAESLKGLFDEHCHGFRVGGDEFMVFVDTEDQKVLEQKLSQWETAMEQINAENKEKFDGIYCHMSAGMAFGSQSDMSVLISEADQRMYRAKEEYHRACKTGE